MISRSFRRHPELAPSGRVTIFGRPQCSAERMTAYAKRRNPDAPEVAGLYLEKGERYNIRGDLAFCQAMHDTRVWTRTPLHPPWGPAVPSFWDSFEPDRTLEALESRTEMHLQRLHAFVSNERSGIACWEDLSGKWLIPGNRYGEDIVAIWRNMREWKGDGDWMNDLGEKRRHDDPAPAIDRRPDANDEHMAWLAWHGLLPSPAPEPDGQVTWAELAQLLRKMERILK